jgi:sterol desaturase/sphingolipid hydroxylase (fatty acid hydroxylase superfamily)
MLAEKFVAASRYVTLPMLLIVFGVATLLMRGTAFALAFPQYHLFAVLAAMLVIERVYPYGRAVCQRHVLWRDLISTSVQAFVAGAVAAAIFLRVLHFATRSFLGRGLLFEAPHPLGPLWVQALAVFLLSSFWGYWMHRFQHYNEFLWKLHGYHHSVTHVQASNLLVSNPFDWALRSVMAGLLLSVVGFDPVAVVLAGALGIYANFSHCGAEMKGGWLSYFFNTPEVHRWHHSAQFPDDGKFSYGCNFGVDTTLWDLVFGTFYLPRDEQGRVMPPPRIGHPSGYADEPNYLKVLLGARAFPSVARLLSRRSA